MAKASVNGVNLYYEVTGEGFPLVWSHEFAGGFESWEPQVKYFSRRYKVITYNARGYPPSDVPKEPDAYSQELAVEDLYQLLRHLNIQQAYIGGLSMGGNVALNFGIAHPDMTRALIVAATGSGTTDRENFEQRTENMARRLESESCGGSDFTIEFHCDGWPGRKRETHQTAKSSRGTSVLLQSIEG